MIEPLSPNTKVDHFVITEILGQGGFGIAYLAKDEHLNNDAVLKEAIPDCTCFREHTTGRLKTISANQQESFETAQKELFKEAQRMASLQNRGIVQIRDVFSFNGSTFLVMPYLSGGSLENIKEEGLPPKEVEQILRCLLKTLSYIHNKKFLHRDIKPDNIVFDESGDPILIDMGSMHHYDTRTTSLGSYTPDYVAPEVYAAKKPEDLTPASDLYSLAATIFELISGVAPDLAMNRLIGDKVKPLSADEKKVDTWGKEFLAAIDKNLALDPKKRMQSADEWLKVLDESGPKQKDVKAPEQILPLDIELLPRMKCDVPRGRRKPVFCYPAIRLINPSSHAYNGLHVIVTDMQDGIAYYNNRVNLDAGKELIIEKTNVNDLKLCPESFVIQLEHELGSKTVKYERGWDAKVNPTVPPFEVYWRRCSSSLAGRNPIIVNTGTSAIEVSLWRRERPAKGNPYRINAGGDFQFSFSEWRHSLSDKDPFWIKIGDVVVNCIIRSRHWRG